MNKGQISLIGVILFAVISISLFIYSGVVASKENSNDTDPLSKLTQEELEIVFKEFDDFEGLLLKKNGLYEQVYEEMKKAGYEYVMITTLYDKDVTWVKFGLTNKKGTEAEKTEIRSIFYTLVEKNNLDSSAFKIRIKNDDRPDW